MKHLDKLQVFLILFFLLPLYLHGQGCEKTYEEGDCRLDFQKGYRMYSQSGGYHVNMRDTLDLNVVFFGQKEYLFTFCADHELYPLHFMIYDPESGSLVYDNREDRYIESMAIGFDVTRNLLLRITAVGELAPEGGQEASSGCVGVLFQYRNYD